MLHSVNVKRSMPLNAWLRSMIANCKHHPYITLLFNILHNLRRFRMSNLRIQDNFNCNLCREVIKACVHAGALDFGKKALQKQNVYGLTPSVASAHHLLGSLTSLSRLSSSAPLRHQSRPEVEQPARAPPPRARLA